MKKKPQFSKFITALVVFSGLAITQECLAIMVLCIVRGYTSTAAWLTAAVGLAECIIGTGLAGYLSLCKVEHSEGGITFEMAKAKNKSKNSPPI